MDGTQSAGSLSTFAKADHVHPTDTSRAASSHTHGSLTNGGTLNSDIPSVNKVAVTDSSNNLKTISKVPFANLNITKDNITGLGIPASDTNTTYSAVTQSANGLAISTDKAKLDKSMVVGFANAAGTTSAYTATITGVTLTHGTIIALYNAVGANAASATLNVNSLGAKPIYYNASAIPASRYPNKATCLFMYNTSIVSTGVWQLIYSYDSNSTYTAASATPLMDGTAAVGTATKYAREDHVHPTDTSRAAASHSHTKSEITDFPTSMTPASHAHGNITNAGAIGSTANLPVITTTSGKLTTGSFGTAANTFCQGNDSRLSDARTPTSHAHGSITNDGKVGTAANKPLITGTNGVVSAGSFEGTATNIKMNGAQSVGSLNTFARGDHVHPVDTSRAPTSHASSATTYGVGTSANYGHNKLVTNLTTDDGDGLALGAGQGKALKALVDAKWTTNTTLISEAIDYNDYKTPGAYRIFGTQQTNSTNAPDQQGGLLIVYDIPNGFVQILIQYWLQSPSIFYRIYHNSAGWRAWRTIATTDVATKSVDGLMSSSDKTKLDGIDTEANAYTHPSGTSKTGNPTSNQSPGFGGSFKVTQFTSNSTGHISGATDRTITLPSLGTTSTTAAAGNHTHDNGVKTVNLNLNSCSGTFKYMMIDKKYIIWQLIDASPGSSTQGTHTTAATVGELAVTGADICYHFLPYGNGTGIMGVSLDANGNIRLTHYSGTKHSSYGSGVFIRDFN